MAEQVHEFEQPLTSSDGSKFVMRAFAEKRGNLWVGWLEFEPSNGKTRRTGQETSQPSKDAVAYWATGLERVYLEGALGRAR